MRTATLTLAVLAAATAPAAAQSAKDKAKAKALYDSGLQHYNLAEYPEAIKDWKEAYSLSKKPLLLFNIGQAYRLSGDCKMAGIFYDNYQREEPSPKKEQLDQLDEALALCAKATDKPAVTDKPVTDKPATDKPVTDKPINDKPVVDKPVNVTNKPTTVVTPVVAPPPATSGGGMRLAGTVVAGAGLVLGGAAIYFALDSSHKASDLDGYTGPWTDEQQSIEDAGKRSQMLAYVTGGVGIAAMIAGGVMFAIGGPKHTETSSVAVTPTRGGAAVGWSFRF